MKHIRYAWYILRHKWFVFWGCYEVGRKHSQSLYEFFHLLWLGFIHDYSKLFPSEWFPYVEYFYGEKTSEGKAAFDAAWLHHQHWNPHHWQHWLLREDGGGVKNIPIPRIYLLEMVGDWIGAGLAITGQKDIAEWYTKNRDKIDLNPEQKALVDYLTG